MSETKRRCTRCDYQKDSSEFGGMSKMCLRCQKVAREQKHGLYEICCTADGQRWHVRHPTSFKTACGQPSTTEKQRDCVNRPVGGLTAALMILKRDPACCEHCRRKLSEVFQ